MYLNFTSKLIRFSVSIIGLTALLTPMVNAQDLVHQPINPSFGGNPFNSTHLLSVANAQNDFEPPQQPERTGDDLDRFVRSLQSRLLSSLSTQVSNAIFGDDAQEQGTIVFGDQTISFNRGLEGVELTITEADGSVTTITVPILQSESLSSASSLFGSPVSVAAPTPPPVVSFGATQPLVNSLQSSALLSRQAPIQ